MSEPEPAAGHPAAVVHGGADDVELIAALIAVTAATGTGPVGRHLSGRGPQPVLEVRSVDPWTAAGRAAVAPPRRTHRWARATTSGPRP